MKRTLLALGLLALLLGILWYSWRSGGGGPQAVHEEPSLTTLRPQGIEPPGKPGGRTVRAVPPPAPSKPVKEPLFWSFFLCDPAGKGISQAHLELHPAGDQEAVEIALDSSGHGRIPLEKPTFAFVSAHAPGFQRLRLAFSGPPTGKGSTRLVLVPLANVPAIRVVEQGNGNPLKGVRATDSKGRKLGTTDEAGRLVLTTWDPVHRELILEKQGFFFRNVILEPAPFPLQVEMEPLHALEIRLTDLGSGDPVRQPTRFLFGERECPGTLYGDTWSVGPCPEFSHESQLTIEAAGYVPEDSSILPGGMQVKLSSSASLILTVLQAPAGLQARCIGEHSVRYQKRKLPDPRVEREAGKITFRFSTVPTGMALWIHLSVKKEILWIGSQAPLDAGEIRTWIVDFGQRVSVLNLLVVDEEDRPLPDAEVHLLGEDFFSSGRTDESGRVVLSVDRPQALGVLKSGYQPEVQVLDASVQGSLRKTIILKKALSIRGRLVSGISGAHFSWPGWVVWARLSLETSSMGQEAEPFLDTISMGSIYEQLRFLGAPVNEDGSFEFSGLASGKYSVAAHPPPGNAPLTQVNDVPAGEDQLVISVKEIPVTFYLEDFDQLEEGGSWGISLRTEGELDNSVADTEGYLIRKWARQAKLSLNLPLGKHEVKIWALGRGETIMDRKVYPGSHLEIWVAPDSKREFLVRWEDP